MGNNRRDLLETPWMMLRNFWRAAEDGLVIYNEARTTEEALCHLKLNDGVCARETLSLSP